MKALYTASQFKQAKSRQLLPLRCPTCNDTCYKAKHIIMKRHKAPNFGYCNLRCAGLGRKTTRTVRCHQCGKLVKKLPNQIKKVKHTFCNSSCAASYRNTHKSKGTKISKLELWLQDQLRSRYPTLAFRFNNKNAIGSELDIYLPSLRLAFEINGIFHYEPIFGQPKLAAIMTNDANKVKACIEHGIALIVIDISNINHFNEKSARPILRRIQQAITAELG